MGKKRRILHSRKLASYKKLVEHPYEQYGIDVLSGKNISCKWVFLACERHFRDKKKLKRFKFIPSQGEAVIVFAEECIFHTKARWANEPFLLEPWQKFIIMVLFGWYKDSGKRRFTSAYCAIPRKNGKTALAAIISLFMLFLDGEAEAEVYYAATKKEQAKICFDQATNMVKKSPILKQVLETSRPSIFHPDSMSAAKFLSKDKDSMDGMMPHCAVIDEYHAHKTDEVSNVLESGMGTRENPLHFTITTAGFTIDGPCHKLETTCKMILEEGKSDESLFAIIYTVDEDDDWRDENSWYKANPNLDVSVPIDYFREKFQKARNLGRSKEVEFKTKYLNMWVESHDIWMSSEIWDACQMDIPDEIFTTDKIYLGVDLAANRDITALAMIAPKDDKIYCKMHYWLPEDTLTELVSDNEKHMYRDFAELDNFHLTPGNACDYNIIRRFISGQYISGNELMYDQDCIMDKHQVEFIGYDPWNGTSLISDLVFDGVPVDKVAQTIGNLSPPSKELERLVLSKDFVHDGDPVLNWMMKNVVLMVNGNGDFKPDKKKSQNKIDGVAALVTALNQYLKDANPFDESYEVLNL